MSIKRTFGPMGSSMARTELELIKYRPNKFPRSPRKFWILFGYKGLFWRLCKVMGIRHAWKQARFGGK